MFKNFIRLNENNLHEKYLKNRGAGHFDLTQLSIKKLQTITQWPFFLKKVFDFPDYDSFS